MPDQIIEILITWSCHECIVGNSYHKFYDVQLNFIPNWYTKSQLCVHVVYLAHYTLLYNIMSNSCMFCFHEPWTEKYRSEFLDHFLRTTHDKVQRTDLTGSLYDLIDCLVAGILWPMLILQCRLWVPGLSTLAPQSWHTWRRHRGTPRRRPMTTWMTSLSIQLLRHWWSQKIALWVTSVAVKKLSEELTVFYCRVLYVGPNNAMPVLDVWLCALCCAPM